MPAVAIAALAALCVWAKLEPSSPHPAKAETECKYTHQANSGKRSRNPTIVLCVQPASEAKSDDTESDNNYRADIIPAIRHWINRTTGDPVAGFTALLFLVTFCLWWATERTLSHGRQATERQLRAYVFVSAEIQKRLGKSIVAFSIKNSGQTPAYEFRIGIGTDWSELPNPTNIESVEPIESGSSSDIGPGQTIYSTIDVPTIEDGEWIDIKNGIRTFYVHGVITYRDAFDRPRRTDFRNYMVAQTDTAWALVTHQNGNKST